MLVVGRAWLLVQAVTTAFQASLATRGWYIRAIGPQAQAAVSPCGCCFPGAWVPPSQSVLGPQRMGPTILSLVPHLLSEAPWDPPSFDLAQLHVWDLNLQGESGRPHGDL